jgi:glycine betaine/proline transport system substrate-binding protein
VKALLETRLGCECEITNTTAALMYESVAAGDQDFMAGAWLPTTQKDYYEKTKGKVVDLGANLVGTRIGLVVPAYVTIAGIGELADHADRFESEIIGIDPGAGIMQTTKKAIEVYGLK